jgi:hypothetical protein
MTSTLFLFFSDYGAPPIYDAYVNVPFGLSHYKNKLFVAIPRRNRGKMK